VLVASVAQAELAELSKSDEDHGLHNEWGREGFTTADIWERIEANVADRTIRDALEAIADLGTLERIGTRPRLYRPPDFVPK